MKYIATAAYLLWATSAFAQSAPVISPNGEYLGTAVKNGNTTLFLDQNGQYGGAVVQNKNGTAYFDKNGYRGVRPNGYGLPPYGSNGYGGRPNGQSYGGRPNGYVYGGRPGRNGRDQRDYGDERRRTQQRGQDTEADWGW